VIEAAKQRGDALRYASAALLNDPQIVVEAVKQRGTALRYASAALRNDPQIVVEAVKQRGTALEYASEALRNDPQIVIEAVKQNWRALEHASIALRNDRHLVVEAVKQAGQALKHASAALRNDPQIVVEAVKQDSNAFCHVSTELTQQYGKTVKKFIANFEAHLSHLKESTESPAATESPAKERKVDPEVERRLAMDASAAQLATAELMGYDESKFTGAAKSQGKALESAEEDESEEGHESAENSESEKDSESEVTQLLRAATAANESEKVLAHRCPAFARCRRWLDTFDLDRDVFNDQHDICFCASEGCAGRHPDLDERGAKPYGFPKGWCGFGIHVDQNEARRRKIWQDWHVGFHGTNKSVVSTMLAGAGQLLKPGDVTEGGYKIRPHSGSSDSHWRTNRVTGQRERFSQSMIFTSPSIKYSASQDQEGNYYYCEEEYFEGHSFLVALQVMHQPDSYKVGQQTLENEDIPPIDPLFPNNGIEYYTNRTGVHKVYRVLVKLVDASAAATAAAGPPAKRARRQMDKPLGHDD
jgi:hypothetical protein